MGGAKRHRGVGAARGASGRGVRAAVLAVLGVLSVLLASGLVLTRGTEQGDGLRPAAASGVSREPVSGPPAGRVLDAGGALRVLHRWDAARAAAWGSGDVEGLRRLYVDGSGAATADVRLLRRYLARGLVVHRLELQTLASQALFLSPSTARLRVTERLVGAVAATSDGARALPRQAQPTTRVVELRRGNDGRWRVATVT